jgi:TRAP-type transport system periplasmic protein
LKNYLLILFILLIELLSFACSKPADRLSSSRVINLRYADQNSSTGWEAVHAAQPWLDRISKGTGGKVQIQAYYSESLTKGVNAWAATAHGLTDIAWMFHGYWADRTSLANVISLPLLPFTSAKQASGILWQLFERYPTLRKQFKENHVLVTWASTPYFLVTTKKQVKTLEDIKGLKIRVPAGPPEEIMKSLGAIPVSIGMPDTYLYLQKGVIDGMATAWESLLSFHQYELVRYYTYIPLFTVYFTQAINNDIWDKLPPEVQLQIDDSSGLRGSLFWGENMFDSAVAASGELRKSLGPAMVEYTMPEEELGRCNAAVRPIWNEWVKKMTAAGYPESWNILNTTLELIDTYKP